MTTSTATSTPFCHAVCSAGRSGTALTLSRKEGAPLECIILPSVLYTEDEAAERLEVWYADLREIAEHAADGVSVFLAVYGGESHDPWARIPEREDWPTVQCPNLSRDDGRRSFP